MASSVPTRVANSIPKRKKRYTAQTKEGKMKIMIVNGNTKVTCILYVQYCIYIQYQATDL